MNRTRRWGALALVGPGIVAAALAAQAQAPAAAPAWSAPEVESLPADKYGRLVREGRELIDKTHRYIGPEVADPAKRYAGNNLACSTCHLDAGRRKFANPFVGTFADYPQYRPREDEVQTIEDRINGCMERSMNGRPLPAGSRELMAMTAYLKFMSSGVPVGQAIAGRGMPPIGFPERAADPVRGQAVYAQQCAACHGAQGQGVRAGRPGDAAGYTFPPLWGPDSYNDGAGMARVIMAARFIRANMPKGVSHDQPLLSEEQAFDVAAYINSQPRPAKSGLEADFPARRNKPVDAAFPPYRSGFTATQHKYGPYKPIIQARDREAAAR